MHEKIPLCLWIAFPTVKAIIHQRKKVGHKSGNIKKQKKKTTTLPETLNRKRPEKVLE